MILYYPFPEGEEFEYDANTLKMYREMDDETFYSILETVFDDYVETLKEYKDVFPEATTEDELKSALREKENKESAIELIRDYENELYFDDTDFQDYVMNYFYNEAEEAYIGNEEAKEERRFLSRRYEL